MGAASIVLPLPSRSRARTSSCRSLEEILEKTLERYRQNAIAAAEAIKQLVEVRKDYFSEDERKEEYNLSNEEIAFIDTINEVQEDAYDMPLLCDLVREVVQSVKNNLEVDWTKPYRENVRAGVRSADQIRLTGTSHPQEPHTPHICGVEPSPSSHT